MLSAIAPTAATYEAEALACRRGERLLFRDLTFFLRAGEAILLKGPNGSGKTSLLRILAGLAPAFAGRHGWQGSEDSEGRRLSYLGHQDAIKGDLSVRENLTLAAALLGSPADPQAALDALGLAARATLPARLLSAGQKRRLALARLALDPAELWLLDEPTTALDSEAAALFERLLAAHLARGGRAIVATHQEIVVKAEVLLLAGINTP